MRQRTRVVSRIGDALGDRAIASGSDKGGKLTIGHGTGIDKEAIDPHAMRWGLFRVVGIGAHPELACLNPHHLPCRMRKSGAVTAVRYSQSRVFLVTRSPDGKGSPA